MWAAIGLLASTCIALAYGLWGPYTPGLSEPQEVVMQEYLAVYCRPPTVAKVEGRVASLEFNLGEAAALSRLTIRMGIGGRALAEYGKCRMRR